MADIYDFNERKKQKEEEKKDNVQYYVEFDAFDDNDYISFTFTPEDLDLELNHQVKTKLDQIETDMSTSFFMEHIANLIEVCSYNVDWTHAPDWHKDMYDRAIQFYDDYYGKKL